MSTVFSLLGGRWAGEAEPDGLRSALAEWAGESLELAGGWTMSARNKISNKINYSSNKVKKAQNEHLNIIVKNWTVCKGQ